MIDSVEISKRVDLFKIDLKSFASSRMVRRHVIFGDCFLLSTGPHFDLKSEVADHFVIHPSEVIIVGSAKLGFSIAPRKRYRHFGNRSDIDLAIVSETLFARVWQEVFDYWNRNKVMWADARAFFKYLFRGWIRPDMLPPDHGFELSTEWFEFFRLLTASGRYGPYKLSGALYKSWHYFESYHCQCVDQCKSVLEVGT